MIGVVIPAGGSGTRMGGTFKPFLELAGRPVLAHALQPFLDRQDVQQIVIALPRDVIASPPGWLLGPRITLVEGGAERMDSVRNGLHALKPGIETVLVHDAARPLVTPELIARLIDAVQGGGSAIVALPASDTVHVTSGNVITATPERATVWLAQTPQAFPRARLLEAHEQAVRAGIHGTDDAALMRRLGTAVTVVEGDARNIKITRPQDLAIAEVLLRANS